MADIKSAWEIAQEKLAKLGEPTAEERLEWKYVPEGEKLAGQYLKDDINLVTEINKFKDPEERKYVSQGAENILIRNISLPTNEVVNKNNKRVMDAIKELKKNKVAVENVYSQMRRIFQHYATSGEEQRKEAYQQLREDFTQRLRQAMVQQGMNPEARVNVDAQPEFQAEWRKMSGRLDEQYNKYIEDFKRQLEEIK
jgi:hypothetical protein